MGQKLGLDVGIDEELSFQFLPEPDAFTREWNIEFHTESRRSQHKRPDTRRIVMDPRCREHGTHRLGDNRDVLDGKTAGFAYVLYETVEIAHRCCKGWGVAAFAR